MNIVEKKEYMTMEAFQQRMEDYRKAVRPLIDMAAFDLSLRHSPLVFMDVGTGEIKLPDAPALDQESPIGKLMDAMFSHFFPNRDVVIRP